MTLVARKKQPLKTVVGKRVRRVTKLMQKGASIDEIAETIGISTEYADDLVDLVIRRNRGKKLASIIDHVKIQGRYLGKNIISHVQQHLQNEKGTGQIALVLGMPEKLVREIAFNYEVWLRAESDKIFFDYLLHIKNYQPYKQKMTEGGTLPSYSLDEYNVMKDVKPRGSYPLQFNTTIVPPTEPYPESVKDTKRVLPYDY